MIAALALAAALAASPVCTVDDATMTWGFKESFRSYISGTIANGEWTVSDGATYETPYFGFSGGTGSLDGGVGTVSFGGSIEFTGHGGILDTIVSNPQIVFDGSDTATLLLDVSGTTQEGEPVDLDAVEFATVKLDALEQDDAIVLTEAATTLTADGAAAFGTYEAGEALDPIAATIPVASGCATVTDRSGVTLLIGAAFAAIVVALVGSAVLIVVLLARRGRRHTPK